MYRNFSVKTVIFDEALFFPKPQAFIHLQPSVRLFLNFNIFNQFKVVKVYK